MLLVLYCTYIVHHIKQFLGLLLHGAIYYTPLMNLIPRLKAVTHGVLIIYFENVQNFYLYKSTVFQILSCQYISKELTRKYGNVLQFFTHTHFILLLYRCFLKSLGGDDCFLHCPFQPSLGVGGIRLSRKGDLSVSLNLKFQSSLSTPVSRLW